MSLTQSEEKLVGQRSKFVYWGKKSVNCQLKMGKFWETFVNVNSSVNVRNVRLWHCMS